MVATYVLALSLVGSVLSDALLPAVVVNGLRVGPNGSPTGSFQAAPVRSFGSAPVFSSPSTFRSQPVFSSVPASPAFAPQPAPFRSFQPSPALAPPPPAPFRSFQPSPAFAPAPAPFRSVQPSPAFAPQPPSRFQSDFTAPAQPSFAVGHTPFAAPTPFGAGSPQSFRIQEDFTTLTGQPTLTPSVVHRVHQQDESGSYSSQFQTSDGQSVSEVGTAKATPDGQDTVISKSGHFSYTSPEGIPVAVSYVADENGFRANSPNIPQNIAQ